MFRKLIDKITTTAPLFESQLMERLFGPIRFIDTCASREPMRSRLWEHSQSPAIFLDPPECDEDHYHRTEYDWGQISLECGHPFDTPLGSDEWIRCRHCRDSSRGLATTF